MYKTHTCGELQASHAGQEVTLAGWVHNVRTFGGVIFLVLRDRYGITQIVFDPAQNAELTEAASELKSEFVVAVRGKVRARPQGQANAEMPTGEVEVLAAEVKLLNSSAVPPFVIEDHTTASEELRLKHRYLDLRRPEMQQTVILRHRIIKIMRDYLDGHGYDVRTAGDGASVRTLVAERAPHDGPDVAVVELSRREGDRDAEGDSLSSCHCLLRRQASCSAHSSAAPISPLSSSSGIYSIGDTRPCPGRSQHSSASASMSDQVNWRSRARSEGRSSRRNSSWTFPRAAAMTSSRREEG